MPLKQGCPSPESIFSRSYDSILPSSFNIILSTPRYIYTHLLVSDYSTALAHFSWSTDLCKLNPKETILANLPLRIYITSILVILFVL
jgi:hypothetical protein